MEFSTDYSPLPEKSDDVGALMRRVLVALVPGTVCAWWYFGPGIPLNMLFCMIAAVAAEALVLRLRGRPVASTLADCTALITGALLGLTLPPLAPWWVPVIGSGFAIIVAKHLYGGLGANPFNPAMAGYVVLLVSFPLQMTLWTPPDVPPWQALGLLDTFALKFGSLPLAGDGLDALTMATPLDTVKTQLGLNLTLTEVQTGALYGNYGGSGWEWINFWFLAGGLWMLHTKTIEWRIPAGMLGAFFVLALVFYLADPDTYLSPAFHCFSGATMLGAFFIATDPVSAATTARGRLIYGAGIGIITYIIRTWGGYPDGVAFGVLLMNMAAPTIDHYTRPRVLGHQR